MLLGVHVLWTALYVTMHDDIVGVLVIHGCVSECVAGLTLCATSHCAHTRRELYHQGNTQGNKEIKYALLFIT